MAKIVKPKINPVLLSTVVMLVKGVWGHGMCHPQSLIAVAILQKLGYKNAKVVKGAAIIPQVVTHRKTQEKAKFPLMFIPENMKENFNIKTVIDFPVVMDTPTTWAHAWIECDGYIIDVNVGETFKKNYVPTNVWTLDKIETLEIGEPLYCVTDTKESQIDKEWKMEGRRLAKKGAKTYIDMINTNGFIQCPEGLIMVDSKGAWESVLPSCKNDNIRQHPTEKMAALCLGEEILE